MASNEITSVQETPPLFTVLCWLNTLQNWKWFLMRYI